MSGEAITVSMGVPKLIGAYFAAVTPILVGVYFVGDLMMDNKLSTHSGSPHPVTLERAEQTARSILAIDNRGTKALQEEMAQIQVKQAGFSSDITWIKRSQLRTDAKIDKILDKLDR